jgi:hypothetical protein
MEAQNGMYELIWRLFWVGSMVAGVAYMAAA